jgi:mono/diheme cytochrome c family protein
MAWLRQQEPQLAFDPAQLKSEEDWIRAGEVVFDAPITFDSELFINMSDVRNPAWYNELKVPVARDGSLPFVRYVIREKGKVELGSGSCATCHARVLPEGTTVKGAQGNLPYDRAAAYALRRFAAHAPDPLQLLQDARKERSLAFRVPWLLPDPNRAVEHLSLEEIAAAHDAIPPGVAARVNTSLLFPPQIPSLFGLRDIRYFDHTGLVRNRSIGDVMRYAALVQGGLRLDQYLDFRTLDPLPDPATQLRYSDAELYALALYLYSLQPPTNPNPYNALAARGKKTFEREGCGMCHTPPLYTNNKLTPVSGFHPPDDDLKRFDILPIDVGTDPGLALKTREGTGYYKVPSLRGVWLRGPFGHSGSVETLEDWFDPRRVRDDYVPTGFRGSGKTHGAVPGHPFGLDLSEAERKALIAFLKTL